MKVKFFKRLWKRTCWVWNVRWQQCALISRSRWAEPLNPTDETWCSAPPKNRPRLSMTASPRRDDRTASGFPFHIKKPSSVLTAAMLLFWIEVHLFPAVLSATWQPWLHLSPRQGACEQQLCQIDTEWREADAPLFTGPLTLLLEPLLMPSQPACCSTPGRNKLKIVL